MGTLVDLQRKVQLIILDNQEYLLMKSKKNQWKGKDEPYLQVPNSNIGATKESNKIKEEILTYVIIWSGSL